jgi:hypothetical protein
MTLCRLVGWCIIPLLHGIYALNGGGQGGCGGRDRRASTSRGKSSSSEYRSTSQPNPLTDGATEWRHGKTSRTCFIQLHKLGHPPAPCRAGGLRYIHPNSDNLYCNCPNSHPRCARGGHELYQFLSYLSKLGAPKSEYSDLICPIRTCVLKTNVLCFTFL